MRLLLASKSPRRRQLIEALDIPVTYININVDETVDDDIPIDQVAETLAKRKADAYDSSLLVDDEWLITADTIVDVDGKKLGKPNDRDEAVAMLQRLSNRSHKVHTGVCLKNKTTNLSFTETTVVCFRQLTLKEIEYYVNVYHPMDKAGAYGIQEWIGMIGVERIEGDYYNVMGLPVARLYNTLMHNSQH